MKKPLLVLIAAVLISMHSLAQTEVKLALVYMPKHTYESNVSSSYKMSMTFTGTPQFMASLKKQGVKQPMLMDMNIHGKTLWVTGNVDSTQHLPIAIQYKELATDVTANGKTTTQPNPLAGKSMYGTYYNGKLHIDSIEKTKIADSILNVVSKSINSIFNQVKYPEKPMKVGDAFTQEMPLNIPIPGIQQATANLNITYKLVQITQGNALFDIALSVQYTFEIKPGATFTANGKGTGKMVYGINQQFLKSMNNNLDVSVHMQLDKTSRATIAMHNVSSQTAVITAN